MSNAELVVSRNGDLVAEILPDSNDWMMGRINGGEFGSRQELHEAAVAIMDSVEPASPVFANGSTCTDGRRRQGLEDGRAWFGVAPQAVGGILLSGFAAAEALGKRFYSPDISEAPTAQRLRYTADGLLERGFLLSRHLDCGGVNGFVPVHANGVRFAMAAPYVKRLQRLVPESIAEYGNERIKNIAAAAGARIRNGVYDDYKPELVQEVIEQTSERPVVERLLDDQQGVHGHRERLVANLAYSLRGQAININKLADDHDGLQTFGVNGDLLDSIARSLSNDGDNEDNFIESWFAMKHYTGSAHGTLAFGMPTILIRENV